MRKQRGFLITAVIVLVIIVAFVGISLVAMHVLTTRSTTQQLESEQAFYLAESGIEQAIRKIKLRTLTCDDTFQSAVSSGAGQFRIKCTKYTPTATTLSAGVTATDTVVPLTSVTGFAPMGQLVIDNEIIAYTGTSTDASICGTAPCVTGASRGTVGTAAATHALGASVSQDQRILTAEGAVPTIASPRAKRVISVAGDSSLWVGGFAWATGKKQAGGAGPTMARDLITKWVQVTVSGLANQDYNGMTMLSQTDGWVVGANTSIGRWNGSSWNSVSAGTITAGKILYGISCVSSNDCSVVGESSVTGRWNGTSWSGVSNSLPNKILYSVSCPATNVCYAVGEVSAGEPLIASWNGTTWTQVSNTLPMEDLRSVFCNSSTDCWAVGGDANPSADTPLIARWDGTSWSKFTPSPALPQVALTSVYCDSVTDCWAVGFKISGTQKALIVHYDGSNWAQVTSAASIPTGINLNGLSCSATDICTAVGNSDSQLYVAERANCDDGSTCIWSRVSSVPVLTSDLFATGLLDFKKVKMDIVGWQEETQ